MTTAPGIVSIEDAEVELARIFYGVIYGDDFELQLMGAVRHALGQGVQPQEQQAEAEDGHQKNTRRDQHQPITAISAGDEGWQMMRGGGVQFGPGGHGVLLLA